MVYIRIIITANTTHSNHAEKSLAKKGTIYASDELYIEKIAAELRDTMAMCGAKTLADITRDMIYLA